MAIYARLTGDNGICYDVSEHGRNDLHELDKYYILLNEDRQELVGQKYHFDTGEWEYVEPAPMPEPEPTQLDRIEAAVQASKEMQDFYDAVMEEVGV